MLFQRIAKIINTFAMLEAYYSLKKKKKNMCLFKLNLYAF